MLILPVVKTPGLGRTALTHQIVKTGTVLLLYAPMVRRVLPVAAGRIAKVGIVVLRDVNKTSNIEAKFKEI